MAKDNPTWELRDEDQQPWGKVWWNGKSIESDNPEILNYLKQIHHSDKGFEDGLEFLQVIPRFFRSAYVTMNRIK